MNAYHPIGNKSGVWYYYEVGVKDGFAERCSLILGNVCTISKGRLLRKKDISHVICLVKILCIEKYETLYSHICLGMDIIN